uniref:N-acetyltransferase domain-containing protein n=1 Tax=Odontella aurita TaxID=265563 RepID=A0A7S4J080_9STRA|mmetsp:Transcript_34668/g.103543  ORF Transcript_34668/g.103543 Transcript_34668/m.103543 type:complete len:213 (+) Transcript_34668:109-747(+)|eukprot:CAMPEP_0113557710 /NCGR_PEP_ID=MMETSP0015_2-20120614/17943_1 /TAXON_ID=2838 /ORGANISM="Odontella" /LENGTH=212 /DNA_ID=CAMNT_0000459167 /DNA_START=99 /DNA_END=737 /DNA_ORIENTATION=+ /assembly_acc=CAM_ASM_000160
MEIEARAPSNQKIIRNDEDEDDSNRTILIEILSEKYFERAREIENEFSGTGKGFCFGLCSYSHCPRSKEDFASTYSNDPDRRSTYALAIRKSDESVVGVMCLRQGGQNNRFDENMMHKPKADEMYVEHIAVTKESRGMGAGTKLLQWAEEKAKERDATMMSLGVVRGNPAKNLYLRFGFTDVGGSLCISSCLIGRPNGRFGADMMEKQLVLR